MPVSLLRLAQVWLMASAYGLALSGASAQQNPPSPDTAKLLQVPVTTLFPGAAAPRLQINTPKLDDPAAARRGMTYFNAMNCVGCHAPNGGGGMGPSLSNNMFIYGAAPENLFLSIYQGRPNGMPAWGNMFPPEVIWDIVAYIRNLSAEPESGWGRTVSRNPPSPTIQQTPAEVSTTPNPWSQTQPFGNGQKP
jgi:cytochrome c oxidase cbb3-type subunit 3